MKMEHFYVLAGVGVIGTILMTIYALWTFNWGLFPRMAALWLLLLSITGAAHVFRR